MFIKYVETYTERKVKTLRTDNGLEFKNQHIKNLLEEHGIQQEFTVAYTPQQNGRAERDNRTIVECARTLLHAKKLPKYLWAEASI